MERVPSPGMAVCVDDNTLVEFAEGLLPAGEGAAVEEHIDRCARCATLVAEFARTLAATSPALAGGAELPWLAPRARVGRYVVAEQLGAGGMGQVYAADDPDLGRRVAIKVVQRPGAGISDERLVREAKAMARLSHPNVVAVHDVGTVGERAFIAMDLVVGDTLESWVERGRRDWREVVDVFAQAGRGLAAAHAAGIVHRDFKPGNVLIGDDGRVQVTDFGLAREQALPVDAVAAMPAPANAGLTQTGALLGTPAYMAPEQLRGGSADARSDQFSFCVAMHEALHGQRPFGGAGAAELAAHIESGEMQTAAGEAQVPARLRRVIERGLKADPDERFPDMHALLVELARDPARTRRLWFATIAFTAVLATAVFVLYRARRGPAVLVCGGGEAKLAAVWNAESRRVAQAAFVASGAGLADDIWQRVAQTIDGYAAEFSLVHREACEVTNVRGEQSAEVLDLRMVCLERRLHELDSLLDIYAEADATVVENAITAAHSLKGLDSCSAFRVLAVRKLEPEDEATATRVNQVLAELARARTLRDAGKHIEALALVRNLEPEARKIGYRRLEAEVFDFIASANMRTRDFAAAEKAAHESLLAAEAGGDSGMVTRAALWLARLSADDQKRAAETDRWLRHAAAALEAAGDRADLARGIADARAYVEFGRGDYADALASYQRVLQIERETLGASHPNVASTESKIGSALYRLGRYRESLAAQRRSLAIYEEVYGAEHPTLMGTLNDLGAAYERVGELDRAIEVHRRSLALRGKTFGEDSPRVAAALNNLGLALESKGEIAEAAKHLERAAAIYDGSGQEGQLAAALMNLGAVLSTLGKHEAAEERIRRALALCEKVFGKDHPHTASALTNLADLLCATEKCASALPLYQRSLEIREARLGKKHVELAFSLEGLALAHRDLGAPGKAVPLLERCLSLLTDAAGRELDVAGLRFALAASLWDVKRDRERARTLARAALEQFAASGDEREGEVRAWLEQRP